MQSSQPDVFIDYDREDQYIVPALQRRNDINVPPRVLWSMSSVNWLLLCFFVISCEIALNSHFNVGD